jgi:hypothetical protein
MRVATETPNLKTNLKIRVTTVQRVTFRELRAAIQVIPQGPATK